MGAGAALAEARKRLKGGLKAATVAAEAAEVRRRSLFGAMPTTMPYHEGMEASFPVTMAQTHPDGGDSLSVVAVPVLRVSQASAPRPDANSASFSEAMRNARAKAGTGRPKGWAVAYVDPSTGREVNRVLDQPPMVVDGRMVIYIAGEAKSLGLNRDTPGRDEARRPGEAVAAERDAVLIEDMKREREIRLALKTINAHALPPVGLDDGEEAAAARECAVEELRESLGPDEPEGRAAELMERVEERLIGAREAQMSLAAFVYAVKRRFGDTRDLTGPEGTTQAVFENLPSQQTLAQMAVHDGNFSRAVGSYEAAMEKDQGNDLQRYHAGRKALREDLAHVNAQLAERVDREMRAELAALEPTVEIVETMAMPSVGRN